MRGLLFALPFLLLSETGPQLPVAANPKAILEWDAPITNVDGTPLLDLAGYIVALSLPGVDLNQGTSALTQLEVPEAATTEQAIAPLVAGRPEGIYQLWVRAYDDAGNLSAWSTPLLIQIDAVTPASPTGLKLKVTVIVEVQ